MSCQRLGQRCGGVRVDFGLALSGSAAGRLGESESESEGGLHEQDRKDGRTGVVRRHGATVVLLSEKGWDGLALGTKKGRQRGCDGQRDGR